jgi:2-oxoisovalerate dehydrogenase E1 component alpha subunit
VSTSAKTCLVGNTGWVTDAAVASPELPEVEPVRFVAPDGAPVGHVTAGAPIADDRLVWLYESMVVTRELDEEFVNLQRQGQLALFPSCRGQEAAQVGCAAALRDSDWLFPQYRELGSFVVRGIEPEGIGLMWRGTWHGGLGFLEQAVAPMSIPVGTHALHAVGAALASMLLGDDGVAVAFVGDGATSVGDVHEALNMAAVQQAPCLFYVQNNQWAISVPLEDQMRAPSIAHRAIGYGMPGVRVDGNDVVACLSVVAEAAQRARAGGGPTLIEAVTYRLGPHTTSDDPARYRSDDEVAAWEALDPIPRFRAYLERQGIWRPSIAEAATVRAQSLRRALRDGVFDARDPDPTELFEHTFTSPTPGLVAQRAELSAELERG